MRTAKALARLRGYIPAYFDRIKAQMIRIFHECEVRIEKSVRGSLFDAKQ